MGVAADRRFPGAVLLSSGSRPGLREAVAPEVPAWDTAAIEAARSSPRETPVHYSLLVGADGADSSVREAMASAKPKIREFSVQSPTRDEECFKSFTGLSMDAVPGPALVPGFEAHGVRQYLYQVWGSGSHLHM